MATISRTQFDHLGTIENPQPNVEFSLQDVDAIWLVLEGSIDVFLVDKSRGSRFSVSRFEPSQAVLSFHSPRDGVELVGATTPGTRLRCISLDDLLQARMQGDPLPFAASSLAAWIDQWVTSISGSLAKGATPKSPTVMTEGKSIQIGAISKELASAGEVLWLSPDEGKFFFLSDTTAKAIRGPLLFPISRYTWVDAKPRSTISAFTTAQLLLRDDFPASLRGFHEHALAALRAHRERSLEHEKERFRKRAIADNSMAERALRRLATPLGALEESLQANDTCTDPVFLACQAVGAHQGLAMKPDPDLLHGVAVHDPVGAIARASGAHIRRVSLRNDWWRQDCGPLLAFRDRDNHPLALLPRSASRYDIFDPVLRTRERVTEEVANGLNPFAYFFYRSFPSRKLSGMDLLRFALPGCRKELAAIAWMGIAAGALSMVTPVISGVIFDEYIPGAERGQIAQMTVILCVVAIATALFTLARNFAVLRLEGKLDLTLQSAYWDRLLHLPTSFFRDFTSGDLAIRSLAIAQIRQTLTGSTVTAMLSGFFSVFSFALLFYYSWRMALLATALVVFAFVVSTVCGYVEIRWQRQTLQMRGKLSGMVLQFVNGLAKLRVSGTERRAFAFWAKQFTQQKMVSVKIRRVTNVLTIFNGIFPLVSLGAIFYFNSYLHSQAGIKQMSTGTFLAFLAAYTQFLTAALLQSSAMVSVLGIVPTFERARPILETAPEVTEAKVSPGILSGAIEISHVTFRYRPDTPLVLRDVSIRIGPGEYVAFVGGSGSGKSTLFRMLLGFERPESGAVYYDNQDLESVDIRAVRRQIGVVLQESRPISGDIFTNIVGSSPYTLDEAWEAARMAGLDKDIKQMAMGMHTMISDGGGGLSGGQRQRLMIARAIVGKPRILLFDEATSALDNRTQAIVSESLEGFRATRIVIAHRLTTIMNAERIYVLNKGSVVQSGTYHELAAQEGLFAELAKRQIV
jgi:NHLM bacteriocin system ABC transporter ATP-binding protein